MDNFHHNHSVSEILGKDFYQQLQEDQIYQYEYINAEEFYEVSKLICDHLNFQQEFQQLQEDQIYQYEYINAEEFSEVSKLICDHLNLQQEMLLPIIGSDKQVVQLEEV